MQALLHILTVALSKAKAPPAWRALQRVPAELHSRGKLHGTPPCLAALEKVDGSYGKQAAWRLGCLEHSDLTLDVLLQLDRNPSEPCCALTFFDVTASNAGIGCSSPYDFSTESSSGAASDSGGDSTRRSRVGRILLSSEAQASSLRGMEIRPDLRGRGLAKPLLASWLHLCAVAGLVPRTREINKPLLSLSLTSLGFAPVNNRGASVSVDRPGHPSRTTYVRTCFELPGAAAGGACTAAAEAERLLGGRLRLDASPEAVRRALTLREEDHGTRTHLSVEGAIRQLHGVQSES